MKKLYVVFTISLMQLVALAPAHAQLNDLLPGGAKKGGGGDIGAQVKAFVDRSNVINGLAFTALKSINAAYASDEESKKIEAEIKAFEASTDPKEKRAKMNEAFKT
jgi:hypothetical protein